MKTLQEQYNLIKEAVGVPENIIQEGKKLYEIAASKLKSISTKMDRPYFFENIDIDLNVSDVNFTNLNLIVKVDELEDYEGAAQVFMELLNRFPKKDTTSQILSEEVSSLASNQNLLNTASRLGMVANTNPVFLRLTDQAVLGEPLPAPIASAQSTNLVANSAMIIESTQINQVTVPASTTEPVAIPIEPVVSSSLIPASPTR
jgi:hypothetical protein